MSYDFYANYVCQTKEQVQAVVEGKYDEQEIPDVQTRIMLLAGALASLAKDFAKAGADLRRPHGHKKLVHPQRPGQRTAFDLMIAQARDSWLRPFGLWQPDLASRLPTLPQASFLVQFSFRLDRAYLSKDDEIFHICDNPLHKDKVFKVPMVAPSGWKGALRAAATRRLAKEALTLSAEKFAERRLKLTRLFGDEKKGEELGRSEALARFLDELKEDAVALYHQKARTYFGLRQEVPMPHHSGRLRFFPTFFDRMDLEVINPHDREKKAGKFPVYFESAPGRVSVSNKELPGAAGVFTLLYVPFDLIGLPMESLKAEVKADLFLIAEALIGALCTYGFGAKTSSGFGMAEPKVHGLWQINYWTWKEKPEQKVAPAEVPYLVGDFMRRFQLGEFPRIDGDDFPSEWGKNRAKLYKRARSEHPDWNEVTKRWRPAGEIEAGLPEREKELVSEPITDLTELKDVAQRLATKLDKEEASG